MFYVSLVEIYISGTYCQIFSPLYRSRHGLSDPILFVEFLLQPPYLKENWSLELSWFLINSQYPWLSSVWYNHSFYPRTPLSLDFTVTGKG